MLSLHDSLFSLMVGALQCYSPTTRRCQASFRALGGDHWRRHSWSSCTRGFFRHFLSATPFRGRSLRRRRRAAVLEPHSQAVPEKLQSSAAGFRSLLAAPFQELMHAIPVGFARVQSTRRALPLSVSFRLLVFAVSTFGEEAMAHTAQLECCISHLSCSLVPLRHSLIGAADAPDLPAWVQEPLRSSHIREWARLPACRAS